MAGPRFLRPPTGGRWRGFHVSAPVGDAGTRVPPRDEWSSRPRGGQGLVSPRKVSQALSSPRGPHAPGLQITTVTVTVTVMLLASLYTVTFSRGRRHPRQQISVAGRVPAGPGASCSFRRSSESCGTCGLGERPRSAPTCQVAAPNSVLMLFTGPRKRSMRNNPAPAFLGRAPRRECEMPTLGPGGCRGWVLILVSKPSAFGGGTQAHPVLSRPPVRFWGSVVEGLG